MQRFLYKLGLWLPPAAWAALIFHFSSGRVLVVSPVYWQDFVVKKIGHVLLFGVLALLVFRALMGEGVSKKKAAIYAIVFATFYGATDEIHQFFTQGRESRVRDVFIDGVGASFMIYIAYSILPKLPKRIRVFFEQLDLI
jgi:VanZ family protein